MLEVDPRSVGRRDATVRSDEDELERGIELQQPAEREQHGVAALSLVEATYEKQALWITAPRVPRLRPGFIRHGVRYDPLNARRQAVAGNGAGERAPRGRRDRRHFTQRLSFQFDPEAGHFRLRLFFNQRKKGRTVQLRHDRDGELP